MKRMIALLISLVMLLSLTACGGDSGEKASGGENEGKQSSGGQNAVEQKIEIGTVEPGLLYDANGLKIYLEGISDDYYGPTVKLSLENSTSEALRVENSWSTVNGHIINGAFSADIPAGEKVENEYILFKQEMELNEIHELAVLENAYVVRRSSDFEFLFMTEPLVIRSSLADSHKESGNKGELVFEDENIRIYCRGIFPDSITSADVMLFIENLSGKHLFVTGCDIPRVNGTELMCIFGARIPPEKDQLSFASFYNNDLKGAGIDKITNLEMNFSYSEYDPVECAGISGTEHITDTVTINID